MYLVVTRNRKSLDAIACSHIVACSWEFGKLREAKENGRKVEDAGFFLDYFPPDEVSFFVIHFYYFQWMNSIAVSRPKLIENSYFITLICNASRTGFTDSTLVLLHLRPFKLKHVYWKEIYETGIWIFRKLSLALKSFCIILIQREPTALLYTPAIKID